MANILMCAADPLILLTSGVNNYVSHLYDYKTHLYDHATLYDRVTN